MNKGLWSINESIFEHRLEKWFLSLFLFLWMFPKKINIVFYDTIFHKKSSDKIDVFWMDPLQHPIEQ